MSENSYMFALLFLPTAIALSYATFYAYCGAVKMTACTKDAFSYVVACVGEYLDLFEYIDIKNVKFLVPTKLPHNVVEVCVLPEFLQAIGSRRHQQIILPEHIWNPLLVKQTQKQSFHQSLASANPSAPPSSSELYVLVEFEMLRHVKVPVVAQFWRWRPPRRVRYCCFYHLQGMMDPFVFPPYPTKPRTSTIHRSIHRASLLLQHTVDGRLRKQYSCDVTPQVGLLSGPRGDFFGSSSVGNQLDEVFVFLHLRQEIACLLDRAREQVVFERLEKMSLEPYVDSLQGQNALCLRLRVNVSPSKVVVVNLNRYMPF